ncbi:M23 family metallopeptidase [Bounagaea algeriensis]
MQHTGSHPPQRIRVLGLLLSTLLPLAVVPPPEPARAGTGPPGEVGTAEEVGAAGKTAAPPPAPHRTSAERHSTAFDWPLQPPRPARPFDPPTTEYGPGHRGVDLAGTTGQPVLAAADGHVAFAGPVADRGIVSLEHAGGLRSTYEPLVPEVAAGEPVARGERIGRLAPGHPDCPPAPTAAAHAPLPQTERACLHWGVRRGETYLDPMRLVHHVTIRLLPWDANEN